MTSKKMKALRFLFFFFQEPWLLHEFSEDFYGEELRLVVVGYIRPEVSLKFNRKLIILISVLHHIISICFFMSGKFSFTGSSCWENPWGWAHCRTCLGGFSILGIPKRPIIGHIGELWRKLTYLYVISDFNFQYL